VRFVHIKCLPFTFNGIFCRQVIAAQGERQAARALKNAADIISESTSALQLRYLQTLSQISDEKSTTIIFPMPIDFNGLVAARTGAPPPPPPPSDATSPNGDVE